MNGEKCKFKISIMKISIILLAALSFIAVNVKYQYTKEADAAIVNESLADEPEYMSKLFDKDKILDVNIDISEDAWNKLRKDPTEEAYYPANITINGTTYYHIGLRAKGNSSLSMVAADKESERYSFKIKADEYVHQNIYGLSKFVLNNNVGDATNMKEYLSYNMFESLGVPTPGYSFAHVTINGEDWGIYSAVEAIEENFVQRNFCGSDGNLYKVEKGFMASSCGSDFLYRDDNIESYPDIFNYKVFDKTGNEDYRRMISIIKYLNEGEDLDNYIDVPEVLKYFAVNTFIVNLDSYSSDAKHNFYVYENEGKLQVLPWDYNLAFGGYMMSKAEKAVNFPIDKPVTDSMEKSPLIAKLLENNEYKDLYHSYYKKLIDTYFKDGHFEEEVKYIDNMISEYVKNDTTAFYNYEAYKTSLPQFIAFGNDRAESIREQLSGEQPSDDYGTLETKVNLRSLGSMDDLFPGMGVKLPKEIKVVSTEIFPIIATIEREIANGGLSEDSKKTMDEMGVNLETLEELKKTSSDAKNSNPDIMMKRFKYFLGAIALFSIAGIFVESFKLRKFHV